MRLRLSSRITLKPDSASLPTSPRRTEILIPLSVRVAELLSRGSYGIPAEIRVHAQLLAAAMHQRYHSASSTGSLAVVIKA